MNLTQLSLLSIITFSIVCGMEQTIVKHITWRQFNRAVTKNNAEIVAQYLEQEKPNPEQLVRSFHKALDYDAIGPVALLLRYGVPVDKPYYKNGPTPLFKMVQKGNVKMVEWLRIFKANRFLTNKDGEDAFEYACKKSHSSENPEEKQTYYEICCHLYAPYALMQMRQYQVQVPEELLNKK